MKFLTVSFLLVVAFVALAFGQLQSEQYSGAIISQPARSIRGDSITYTAGLYYPSHMGVGVIQCKGAVLLPTGTAGYLNVHLRFDPPAARYRLYLPNDGLPVGVEFDFVDSINTTVALDSSLYLFPFLKKQ